MPLFSTDLCDPMAFHAWIWFAYFPHCYEVVWTTQSTNETLE